MIVIIISVLITTTITIEIITTTITAITMIAIFCRFSDRLSCRQAELENYAAVVQHLLCSRR